MPVRKGARPLSPRPSPKRSPGQTTLDAGEDQNAEKEDAGRPPAAPESELSSDFALQFREMAVDREAMRNCYLIHEHDSRRLHWDLRLEKDGVLKSWAVPKEPPAEEGVKRLAVAVEDHPLGYATFEGQIPEGNYGAGSVRIWDRGSYEPLDVQDGKWVIRILGERLRGKYCLVRLRPRPGERGENWLFFKVKE